MHKNGWMNYNDVIRSFCFTSCKSNKILHVILKITKKVSIYQELLQPTVC
jgi:hypothetical protein